MDLFLQNRDERALASDATAERILAAAEALFAANGFAEVSVRDITAAAGVNLAAVNYHFGSRDGLLFEIFSRRSAEINRARARLLHEAGPAPSLRAILEALIAPGALWLDPRSPRYVAVQFLIRARSEGTEAIRKALSTDVSALTRFSEALQHACPDLTAAEVHWRLHFTLGVIHQNKTLELERLAALHPEAGRLDVAGLIRRMVEFTAAGFEAR